MEQTEDEASEDKGRAGQGSDGAVADEEGTAGATAATADPATTNHVIADPSTASTANDVTATTSTADPGTQDADEEEEVAGEHPEQTSLLQDEIRSCQHQFNVASIALEQLRKVNYWPAAMDKLVYIKN